MTDEMAPPPWPDQLGRPETLKRLMAMKASELQSIANYEGIKVDKDMEVTANKIMGVWFDKARPDFPPPSTPPSPRGSGSPLGQVIYPKPQEPGLFDRRAVKQQLKTMTLAEIQAIADQENIKPDSKGAVFDKWDMIPLILDVWQARASGAPETPRTERVNPAPPVVPMPDQSRTGERDALPWPLELGSGETIKRLKTMKVVELEAIAKNEGLEVGPKKADTIDRIVNAWFVQHTATRFQPRIGPEEPPSGMSARVKRISQAKQA